MTTSSIRTDYGRCNSDQCHPRRRRGAGDWLVAGELSLMLVLAHRMQIKECDVLWPPMGGPGSRWQQQEARSISVVCTVVVVRQKQPNGCSTCCLLLSLLAYPVRQYDGSVHKWRNWHIQQLARRTFLSFHISNPPWETLKKEEMHGDYYYHQEFESSK
jgi:hypothetical protein